MVHSSRMESKKKKKSPMKCLIFATMLIAGDLESANPSINQKLSDTKQEGLTWVKEVTYALARKFVFIVY